MLKNPLLPAVLSLFLLVPASITWAQTVTSQKGLTTAVFTLQQGKIIVYLPDDIRPGDHISGRVVAEPFGKNEKQTEKNRSGLKSYFLNLYKQAIPVENSLNGFNLSIPAGIPQRCSIGLTGPAGIKTPTVDVPSFPETGLPSSPVDCTIPSHALAGAPMRITGPFDGDASNTRCTLENKALEILAESPRSCIVHYPLDAKGMNMVNVQESGKPSCGKKVSGVDLELKAGKLNLLRGEKTTLEVKVTGLQDLQDTARLMVTNASTQVITMTGGNNTTLTIPPKNVGSSGTYTQQFNIQSIQSGTYTVNAGIDLPEPVRPVVKPLLYLRTTMTGSDISVNENGNHLDSKEKEPVQVHFDGNTILIYFDGLYQAGFGLTNPGEQTVEQLIKKFSNPDYADPKIGCDSLTRICRKHGALNVFWGDVFSVFEGKAESRVIHGQASEKGSSASLLITRGWEINCCTGTYELIMSFQTMVVKEGNEKHDVSFSKILKTGDPCPIICPECEKNCKEIEDQKKKNGFGN